MGTADAVVQWGLVLVGLGAGVTLLLLFAARFLQRRTGLSSDAEVVASDTGQARVKKMWDRETGLYGKPDYVLREHGRIVPVEVKPTRRSRRLYTSDELQLVVYMILLRAEYGDEFAGYGYVRYKDVTFTVQLTPERVARCLAVAEQVRAARRAANVHRTHRIKGRCVGCGMRRACMESLA